MKDLYLYNFDKEEKDDMVFWSGGNFPTQKSLCVSLDDVRLWFKALFLLSGKIIASSSFYYESEITRAITKEFNELFRTENVLYFVDENILNFVEHGMLKNGKSPKTFSAYNDINQIRIYGNELDALGVVLRRPSDSISKKIQYIWASDVYSKDSKSLGMFLQNSMKITRDREEASLQLSGIAVNPPVDFVWDYIVSEASEFSIKLPKGFDTFARNRLSEIYALACAEVLDLQLDLTLMDRVSRYDTRLFCQCMKCIGVLNALNKLNSGELIFLKQKDEFSWFQKQYFKLIKAVNNNEERLKQSFEYADKIRLWSDQKILFQQGLWPGVGGVKNLIRAYFEGNNQKIKEYEKPIDILLSAYDMIANDIDKRNLVKWLDELIDIGTVKIYPAFEQKQGGNNKMTINVVIVTAIHEEFEAVKHSLQLCGNIDLRTHPHKFSVTSEKGFLVNGVLIEAGMGQVKAGIATLTAVMKYSPDIVVLTGIIGGLGDDIMLGDIIIGEQYVYYENEKIMEGHPNDVRPQVTRGDINLLTTARNLPRESWIKNITIARPQNDNLEPQTYFGVVLTGDKIVADTDFVTELKTSWSRAIGIEMESYGASMAVEHSSPRAEFLMVKSVSDMADGKKCDSWHDYCTDVAASYTVALIKNHGYRNRQTPNTVAPGGIPGPVLVKLNERLFTDWKTIATWLEIPEIDQVRFDKGREIFNIHEWLKQRNRVNQLYDAIFEIGRKDVIDNPGNS